MKLILLGNAGAGKSTMARRIIGNEPIPRLSLDQIAWDDGPNQDKIEQRYTEASGGESAYAARFHSEQRAVDCRGLLQ